MSKSLKNWNVYLTDKYFFDILHTMTCCTIPLPVTCCFLRLLFLSIIYCYLTSLRCCPSFSPSIVCCCLSSLQYLLSFSLSIICCCLTLFTLFIICCRLTLFSLSIIWSILVKRVSNKTSEGAFTGDGMRHHAGPTMFPYAPNLEMSCCGGDLPLSQIYFNLDAPYNMTRQQLFAV